MEGKVYISAKDEMKKKIKLAMAKQWQIIYTDNLQEADIPVRYFKLGKEKTQIAAMKETRKNFDMEIE